MEVKQIKRSFILSFTFGVIIFLIIGCKSTVFALNTNTGIDFSVQPLLESHQKNKNLNYWWLDVKPNETIHLELLLTNGNAQNTFELSSNQAVTNQNFAVDYGQTKRRVQKVLSNKGPVDFYQDVFFGEQGAVGKLSLTLQPNQTLKIPITVKLPSNAINGQAVGGINITRIPKNSERKNGILNVYSRAIALVLQSGHQAKFKPAKVSIGTMGLAKQTLKLSNPSPLLIQFVKISAVIKDKNGKTFSSFSPAEGAILPYTKVTIPLYQRSPLESNSRYVLSIKTDYERKSEKDQTITYLLTTDKNGKVSFFLDEKMNLAKENKKIVGCIIVVVVVLFGVVSFFYKKERKK